MATISGLGGANPNASVYSIVQQYMQLEQAGMDRLEEAKSDLELRNAAYDDLGSKLRDLRTQLSDFRWTGSLTPLNTFASTSSDESAVEITVNGSASEGLHTVNVRTLARAHSIASREFVGEDATSLAGTHTFQVTQGGETFEISVTIDAEATNQEAMSSIVSAINASGAGVAATLAATDSRTDGYRILLTSRTTGTDSMISEITDTNGTLASQLGLNGSSTEQGFSDNTVQKAADAKFSIDGLDFVSSTNQVSGALTGVTLNLSGVTEDGVTVAVERDVDAIRESIEDLLESYNALVGFIGTRTRGADETGEGRGLMTGNTLFMSLRTQIRREATGDVADPLGEAELVRLSQIGITADREGKLSISDTEALEDALATQPTEVVRLFSEEDEGIAVRITDLVDTYVKAGGLLAQQDNLAQMRMRTIDQRIEREEERLLRREDQLMEQFASLQNVLSQLSQQQQILSAMGSTTTTSSTTRSLF